MATCNNCHEHIRGEKKYGQIRADGQVTGIKVGRVYIHPCCK